MAITAKFGRSGLLYGCKNGHLGIIGNPVLKGNYFIELLAMPQEQNSSICPSGVWWIFDFCLTHPRSRTGADWVSKQKFLMTFSSHSLKDFLMTFFSNFLNFLSFIGKNHNISRNHIKITLVWLPPYRSINGKILKNAEITFSHKNHCFFTSTLPDHRAHCPNATMATKCKNGHWSIKSAIRGRGTSTPVSLRLTITGSMTQFYHLDGRRWFLQEHHHLKRLAS